MLNDAIWLAKKEFKQHWIAVVFTFLFSMIIGSMVGIILSGTEAFIIEINDSSITYYMLDFIIIGVAPGFGAIYMAKPYLSYKAAVEEPYGKRMAVLRSLPISISAIALSRTLVMLVILALNTIALFGTAATVLIYTDTFSEFMSVGEYVAFVVLWFGVMLALGGMSPFMENGLKGRYLYIVPFIYIILFIILIFSYYPSIKKGIIDSSIDFIHNGGWYISLLSLIIGIIFCYAWHQLLKRRLTNRDYV
ncbi:MAG TPA: hypothetical protein VKZ77_13815 [Bacillaceae bacterium]|nr:hypothetical protein [Bacillaceae bacterium]